MAESLNAATRAAGNGRFRTLHEHADVPLGVLARQTDALRCYRTSIPPKMKPPTRQRVPSFLTFSRTPIGLGAKEDFTGALPKGSSCRSTAPRLLGSFPQAVLLCGLLLRDFAAALVRSSVSTAAAQSILWPKLCPREFRFDSWTPASNSRR